jgi:hypothetical protein
MLIREKMPPRVLFAYGDENLSADRHPRTRRMLRARRSSSVAATSPRHVLAFVLDTHNAGAVGSVQQRGRGDVEGKLTEVGLVVAARNAEASHCVHYTARHCRPMGATMSIGTRIGIPLAGAAHGQRERFRRLAGFRADTRTCLTCVQSAI